MAKYPMAALQAAMSPTKAPKPKLPGQDQPLTKAQAQAGAKASGGTASQDFKNNGEWVYGPKPKNAQAGSQIVNDAVRNWMTNGNASRGPRT